MGRDAALTKKLPRYNRFNPRARVGRDKRPIRLLQILACFNPRARVGRDSPGYSVPQLQR